MRTAKCNKQIEIVERVWVSVSVYIEYYNRAGKTWLLLLLLFVYSLFAFRHVQYFPSRISIFHFMASHDLFVYIKYLLVSLLALSSPLETTKNTQIHLKAPLNSYYVYHNENLWAQNLHHKTPTKKWRCVKPNSNKNFTYERFHANWKTITNTTRLYLLTVNAIGSTHANCIDIWCRFFSLNKRKNPIFFFLSYTHIFAA